MIDVIHSSRVLSAFLLLLGLQMPVLASASPHGPVHRHVRKLLPGPPLPDLGPLQNACFVMPPLLP